MRFMDAPQPDPHPSLSAQRGKTVFNNIGCALCHTPQMQTAPAMNSAVLENRPVNLYSDLLVHHMGVRLADDIIQGAAGPDEFRTPAFVGRRATSVLPARRADQRLADRDLRSQLAFVGGLSGVGSQCGDQQFPQPAESGPAGHSRFPALAVICRSRLVDVLAAIDRDFVASKLVDLISVLAVVDRGR